MFTHFWDMSSGGSTKIWRNGAVVDPGTVLNGRDDNTFPLKHIYIEQPQEEAVETFQRIFGRDPWYITCECCGEDYSISEYETLEEATGYQRHSYDENRVISLEEYHTSPNALILYQTDLERML